jgi:4'-phosphopantetheinyl transferase
MTCSVHTGDRAEAPTGRDGPPALPADVVDCWFVRLTDFPRDARDVAFALLSADEQEAARRFHFDHHRELYVRSHAALRLLLAHCLQVAPSALVIAPDGSGGRPILAVPSGCLHFNLSHSGEAALVAVAESAPVGVDIELVRELPDFVEIAGRFFAPAEVADLCQLDPADRLGAFYVTWTRKEAFVKGLGLGLSYPLDAFCTGAQDRPPHLTRADGTPYADWTMADLAPAAGYKAAIAVQRPRAEVRCREAQWPWLVEGLQQPTGAI